MKKFKITQEKINRNCFLLSEMKKEIESGVFKHSRFKYKHRISTYFIISCKELGYYTSRGKGNSIEYSFIIQNIEPIHGRRLAELMYDKNKSYNDKYRKVSTKKEVVKSNKIDTKKCGACGKILTLDNFSKNSTMKDGLRRECKDCHRTYMRNYQRRVRSSKKSITNNTNTEPVNYKKVGLIRRFFRFIW